MNPNNLTFKNKSKMKKQKIFQSIIFMLFLSLNIFAQADDQPVFQDMEIIEEEEIVEDERYPKNENGVYRRVEEMPRFPNSDCEGIISNGKNSLVNKKVLRENCAVKSFLTYVENNLEYPEKTDDGIMTSVVVWFTIAKDGTLKNIGTQKGLGGVTIPGSANVEALVQKMNDDNIRWIPGKHKGETVEVVWSIPIKLKRS